MDPVNTVRRLCNFVESEPEPAMIEMKAQKSSITDRQSAGFDKRAGMRWKEVISPLEGKTVSLLTGRAMSRFGYDPETHPIYLATQ